MGNAQRLNIDKVTKNNQATKKNPTKDSSNLSNSNVADEFTDDTSSNVDKIRDIIFGSQMKDYEERFSKLDIYLTNELRRLREDSNAKFNHLEGYLKNEFSCLRKSVDIEEISRTESVNSLQLELKKLDEKQSSRSRQIAKQLNDENSALRLLLHEKINDLLERTSNLETKLTERIDAEHSRLESAKVEKSDLAQLLNELSSRISNTAEEQNTIVEFGKK